MLTQLYRFGATGHRLRKGYIVAGAGAVECVAALLKRPPAVPAEGGPPTFGLHHETTAPTAVWIDTGFVPVHTPRARKALFARLATVVAALAAQVAKAGCLLLPNAVRPTRAVPWHRHLCPDFHTVETEHPTEQEVLCNAFRRHLPLLVAMTGRAGAGEEGVEPLGSRLLCDSSRHLTARHFASVSEKHLGRVREALRRDHGIDSLAALDVVPVTTGPVSGVEMRATDGTAFLSTAAAELLLYQALALRARRVARGGGREIDVPQWVVERDRVRAIADGPSARLTVHPPAPLEGHIGPPTQATGWRAFLDLVESLRYEFKALDATFAEIAPLVLGPGLRAVGAAGVSTESEYLRELHRRCQADRRPFVPAIAERIADYRGDELGELAALNEKLHPTRARAVRDWWQSWLMADWPQPPLRPPPAPPKPPDPKRFARGFFEAFLREGPKAPPRARAACLREYAGAGGPAELGDTLALLPPAQSRDVWPWLTADVPVFRPRAPDWASAADAVAAAERIGLAIVEFPGGIPGVAEFAAARPRRVLSFRLDEQRSGRPGPVAAVLLCPAAGGGS